MLKTWKINWMRQTLQQSSVGYTQNLVAVRAMKVAKKARIKTLVCDAFSSTSFSSKLPLYCLWLTRKFFFSLLSNKARLQKLTCPRLYRQRYKKIL
jgi:hypothetical protein